MINNKFRTSLTRDEIIGTLLGWIDGPSIALLPENETLSEEEQEIIEGHVYNIYENLRDREETAWEKYSLCIESGEPTDLCRQEVENFKQEERAFQKLCDEFDDEISKGERSILRIDQTYSSSIHTCYTRKSFDEWVSKNPELSAAGCTRAKPLTRKKTKGELRGGAILACIRDLGYDPKRLTPPKRGHSGIKAEVRAKLQHDGKEPFPNSDAFDRAWERLRKIRMIVDID